MPATIFAGSLPGSRVPYTLGDDINSKNNIGKLIKTIFWTSRTYHAILKDALRLDLDHSIAATSKLVALCVQVVKMMKSINDNLNDLLDDVSQTVTSEQQHGRSKAQTELEEFSNLVRQTSNSRSTSAGANIPWETAMELLLHILVQTSQHPPSLEDIRALFDELIELSAVFPEEDFKEGNIHSGLPATAFVCRGPHVSGQTPLYVITTSAERWRIKSLSRWAVGEGKKRRRSLIEHYEAHSIFGQTIELDRELIHQRCIKAIDAIASEPGAAFPYDPATRKTMALQEQVQQWLITQGPGRVQEHFDELGAAFEVTRGLPFKARCIICRATFCCSMPALAWLAEDLQHTCGIDKNPVVGSPLGCAELLGRILCNAAKRGEE